METNQKGTSNVHQAFSLTRNCKYIDDSTISANGLRTLKRARSPGHDLDSGSRRKRPRLTEGSDGQDGNGMTSINCPDEQDELEGPNGWRPTIEDFVHHRGSYFSADLPFPYAETVHKSDSAFWRTFTSAVRNTGLLLDSIQAFKDVQQDPKQPGKPPINKVKRNKPAQVSPLRKDIDLHGFKACGGVDTTFFEAPSRCWIKYTC
ncbi:hypothetical protein CPB86DRAFT_820673 [Serendipita vermifera]|nr:hypothetical protein CPB86DRAFT_820673 [Serendipita vermifera]